MIEVHDLTKVYPGVIAVDRATFTIERGQIVGFLGPNGAGKSTTMRILTCFIPPTSGTVSVAGFDVLRESMKIRRTVGYLPENNPLYTEMRVSEYLEFRARIKGVPRAERLTSVDSAIDRCGLTEKRHAIVDTLSKGYRQRVGLADAILADPEIVILDEPTIGLDPNQVRAVREVIRELGQKRTVILSTHILSEVEKMCGRVLIINRGRIVADGTPHSIVNKFTVTGRVRIELRGRPEGVREAIEAVPNVRPPVIWMDKGDHHVFMVQPDNNADLRTPLFQCAARNGWELVEIGFERVSLEDAFVELTVGSEIVRDTARRSKPPQPQPVKPGAEA